MLDVEVLDGDVAALESVVEALRRTLNAACRCVEGLAVGEWLEEAASGGQPPAEDCHRLAEAFGGPPPLLLSEPWGASPCVLECEEEFAAGGGDLGARLHERGQAGEPCLIGGLESLM